MSPGCYFKLVLEIIVTNDIATATSVMQPSFSYGVSPLLCAVTHIHCSFVFKVANNKC